jgi:Domain of unknown function (DUF4112)
VHEAYHLGAPTHVTARMLGNVALVGVFGTVPLVGDAFDVLWRANLRNITSGCYTSGWSGRRRGGFRLHSRRLQPIHARLA